MSIKHAQQKAVERHRRRRLDQGIQRLEISVPEPDKQLVRELAATLRKGGDRAERLRDALGAALRDVPKRTFLDFLASGPGDELERLPPSPNMRDVDL